MRQSTIVPAIATRSARSAGSRLRSSARRVDLGGALCRRFPVQSIVFGEELNEIGPVRGGAVVGTRCLAADDPGGGDASDDVGNAVIDVEHQNLLRLDNPV